MTRPTISDLEQGLESWAAFINDTLKAALVEAPFPIMEYADYSSLPTAGSYDRCLAVTTDTSELWISDGTNWRLVSDFSLDTSGGRMRIGKQTTELTGLTGATVTWSGAFPAGVRQLGVAGRVTTPITASGGGTTLNVGDHGSADPNRYASGIAFAAGTTFKDAATADPTGWAATAQDVVLSPDVGAFTAGAVRLVAFYLESVAPTS